jgi:peptide/nickel transport system substrate-binding protein
MTRRFVVSLAAAMTLVASLTAVWMTARDTSAPSALGANRTIVASIRGEPRSFNRYVARDLTTQVVTFLLHAPLVRVNQVSQRIEPELAEQWTLLPDGVTYRLRLRHGVHFSDGVPFTADDVVFSFNALYDERTQSPLAEMVRVNGQPLVVAADGPETVTIRLPAPFGPGLRVVAAVPMLPRHKLDSAFARGTFTTAWGPTTAPTELAGLGPFVLRRYEAGQRLMFDRNPRYWKPIDRSSTAAEHMVLEIIKDQNAEELRMESGALDFTQSEVRPADWSALKRAADAGRVTLDDLGIAQDGDLLWFNLQTAKADPKRPWLQAAAFRRAISHAVNRDAFVNDVYFGAATPAYGVVSPANAAWYRQPTATPYDLAASRRLLESLGLLQRNGREPLEDRRHRPVTFTLLTQKGNTALERGAAVIRDSLQPLGISVDVVPLEVGTLVARFTRGDYDAVYFRLLTTDTDPAMNLDFWLSSRSAHVWNPSQPSPATTWEQEIDTLMEHVASTLDQSKRRALFGEVQRIMDREVPVLCFAFPRVWVAMNRRIVHATPAAVHPPILWNPAPIGVAGDAR